MPIWNIKILYYDRIDVTEGIDAKKTSESKFQPNVCNECHGLLLISMNLRGIAILRIQ